MICRETVKGGECGIVQAARPSGLRHSYSSLAGHQGLSHVVLAGLHSRVARAELRVYL